MKKFLLVAVVTLSAAFGSEAQACRFGKRLKGGCGNAAPAQAAPACCGNAAPAQAAPACASPTAFQAPAPIRGALVRWFGAQPNCANGGCATPAAK